MLRMIMLALLMLAGPAAAQVTGALAPANPKLKELVVVSNDVVLIGDLVDNAGSSAHVAVFRAPDLGYTGGVPIARVIEALAPYQMASLDTGTITEVTVTRLSRAITIKEIEARIARALAGQYGFGDAKNITINFDRDLRTIHVEPGATDDIQLVRLNVDPRSGRFNVAFELQGSATARRLGLRFSGTAVDTVEAIVLTRSLNRGEIIKSTDIATERKPKSEIAGEFVTEATAVGFATKRVLRSGTVLRQDDLLKPDVVQRNEMVTIVYEAAGIMLTVRGKALEAGSMGDLINVQNIQSNRTVQAMITGSGRVNIATTPRPTMTTGSIPDSSNSARPSAE